MSLISFIILFCTSMLQASCEGLVKAKDGQFPSLVAILDLKMNYVTTGSLITTYHVLSAARWHVPGKSLMALAGDVSLLRTPKRTRQIRSVIKTSIHPKYKNKENLNYDVAISMVSKPFKIFKNVQPNQLCGFPPEIGDSCFSIGWSLNTKTERESQQTNTLKSSLQSLLSNVLFPFSKNELRISNTLLCQELEVAPPKLCGLSSKSRTICVRKDQNQNIATEIGGPLICSHKQCGIFLDAPHINGSISSFKTIRPILDWVEKQITLKSHEIADEYVKRSHAKKKDVLKFWMRCIEIFRFLMYFI